MRVAFVVGAFVLLSIIIALVDLATSDQLMKISGR